MARFCPNCGAQVDDNAPFCPNCGAKQAAPQQVAPQQPIPQQPVVKKEFMIPGVEEKPVDALKNGNTTLYSFAAIFFSVLAFIMSLIPIFKIKIGDDKNRSTIFGSIGDFSDQFNKGGGLMFFRIFFMILFIASLIYLVIKIIMKKFNGTDLKIALAGQGVYLFINIVAFNFLTGAAAVSGALAVAWGGGKIKIGPNFGGVLYFIFSILAILCLCVPLVVPAIQKLIKKKH